MSLEITNSVSLIIPLMTIKNFNFLYQFNKFRKSNKLLTLKI